MQNSLNHRRHLTVNYRILEGNVKEWLRLVQIESEANRGDFHVWINDIPAQQKAAISAVLDQLLVELRRIRLALSAEQQCTLCHKHLLVSVVFATMNLDFLNGKSLAGYGPMPSDLERFADETVECIRSLLGRLEIILS